MIWSVDQGKINEKVIVSKMLFLYTIVEGLGFDSVINFNISRINN